jgi:phenylacetic acid degradation operon negative regulatory protein
MIPSVKDPQPQQLVVTLLGAYVRDEARTVWSGGLVQVLDLFGSSAPAARIALLRMVRRGLLVPHKNGRTVYYSLSDRMRLAIRRGDERLFHLGDVPRDGEPWTLLWHLIPDQARQERALLGRRLRFAGFGSPQDGVWWSPADRTAQASELVRELGVEDFCSIFVAAPAEGRGIERLVDSAWDLDELAESYASFLEEFSAFRATTRRRTLSDVEALRVHVALAERFRVFAATDPGLPEQLGKRLPMRRAAIELFDVIYPELKAPAQRAFDELTAPP